MSKSIVMMQQQKHVPGRKVHGANMGPTWVLWAQEGPHVGPMNLDIMDGILLPMWRLIIVSVYLFDKD